MLIAAPAPMSNPCNENTCFRVNIFRTKDLNLRNRDQLVKVRHLFALKLSIPNLIC